MRALFFLGLLILSVPIVQAQSAAVEALPPFLQSRVVDSDPLMDFRTQSVPQGRIDRDTGVLRAAYRLAPTVPLGATHEATARAYLDAEAERFGWATADDLLLVREIDGHYSAHLTFQQTFGGIPVHNRFVKVNMGSDGHPSMVISGYAPHLRDAAPVRLLPLMDASGAVLRAQQATLAQRVSTPELVVYPSASPRLAWQMIVSPDGVPAAWEVLMDADTGEILYLKNQAMYRQTLSSPPARAVPLALASSPAPAEPTTVPAARAVVDGTGLVFDPDPLTSAGVLYGAPYVDNDDADVAELNAERKEVVLRDITRGSDGRYRLIGPYVEITGDPDPLPGGRAWTPPAEADPNAFRYGRGNDFFEAVMVYYHVDKNQRYIQSLDVGRPIREFPFRVNPHGSGPNSVYIFSRDPEMYSFGDKDVDGAEDADTILRLYAVALLLDSVPGIFDSPEIHSIEDGWVYYWIASYSRGLVDAREVPVPEVQSWRTIENWTSGDRLHTPIKVNFPVRDKHNPDLPNGGLWATTMMEIYDELGKRVTDRLILASHAYLGSSSILVDKAEALLQADEDLYAGENESVLREKLVAREYLSVEDDAQSAALVLTILRSGGRPIREGRSRTLSVSVELDAGVAAADISVDISITGGTAEEGADYRVTSAPSQVVIPEGYSNAFEDIQIQTVDDDIAEDNETIVIEVSAPGLTSASQNLTIRDNDTASTALVLAGRPSSPREEGRSRRTVDITVSLNADASTTDIPVEISVMDGTAEEDADYRVLSVPDALVIPAGELSVMDTVRIRIIDDNIAEGDETVVIGASAPGLRSVSWNLTIRDDDVASDSLVLTINPGSLDEGSGAKIIGVKATLNGAASTADIPVEISVTDGTAEEDADYRVSSNPISLVIPGGMTSVTGAVPITIVDDDIVEGDETVTVEASATGLTSASEEFTIRDNDVAAPTSITLSVSPSTVAEEVSTAPVVTVTATVDEGTFADPQTVMISVGAPEDSAEEGTDYVAVSDFSITIPAGVSSGAGTFPLDPVDDDVAFEGDETLAVSGSLSGVTVTPTAITITERLLIIRAAPSRSLLEYLGTQGRDFVITIEGDAPTSPTAVTISVTDGTATSPADYTVVSNPSPLVIPVGETSLTGTVQIGVVDDNLVEGYEDIKIMASAPGFDNTSSTYATIVDNDAQSDSLVVTLSPESAEEGAGTANVDVTVSLNAGVRTSPTEITLTISDGTATGADYSVSSSTVMLQIPAEMTSVTQTVPITIVDDNIVEGNETVTIEASATSLTRGSEDFTIKDNVSITLSVSPSSVAEDVGTAPVVTVTATVDGGTFTNSQTVMVSIGASEDSAEEGTDYTEVSDFTLTIAATAASGTDTFTLAPVDDSIFEGDETLTVLGSLSGVTVTPTELTITDNDAQSDSLVVTLSPESAEEGAGTANVDVTVSLNAGVRTSPTEITLTISDGTATGADYSVSSSTVMLQIPAEMTSVTQTVPITIVDDNIVEGNETVTIEASATGLTRGSEDFTIKDNVSITLSVSPSSVAEDVGTAPVVTVTATVDGGTFTNSQTVMVSIGASEDSAEEGTDYTEVSDFTLTIAATAASGTDTFTLAPVDDSIFEGDETLTVLGSLSGVTVTPTELTITDNDAQSDSLVVTLSPESVDEDADLVSIAVTAAVDGGTFVDPQTVMVSVGALGDSAVEGIDYYRAGDDFPIVIPAGDASATGTLTLFLVDDDIQEPGGEFFTIEASASGLTSASQELVIVDDDTSPLPVTLIVSPFSVVEEVGTALVVTVTALLEEGTFAGPQTVTVSVGTLEDSATEGTDYVAVDDFMIMIPARSPSATGTFTLDPIDDTIAEGSETVSVVGTLLSGATVMPAKITITDKFLTLEPNTPFGGSIFLAEGSLDPQDARFIVNTRGDPRTSPIPVTISVIDGTATSPADYTVVSVPSSLVIPAGKSSVRDNVEINVIDDNLVEETETITIFASASGFDNTASLNVAITDNDVQSDSLVVTLSPASAVEGAGTANVDVTVGLNAGARTTATEVTLTITDGTATSADYSVSSSTVILQIPEGMTSVTETVPITIVNDDIAEEAETVTIAAEATGLASDSEEFTITDDDAAPTSIALSVSPSSVAEDVGTATSVTVTATVEGSTRFSEEQTVMVSVGKSGDSAVEGTDYAEVDDIEITIAATAASGTHTFMLSPMDDAFAEGEETISVEESVAGALSGVTVTSTEITITDDDAAPTSIALSVSPSSVAESATATNVTVTATVEGSTRFSEAQTLTVSVGKSGDSAVEGTDYVTVDDIEITIAATAASGTHTFTLSPMDDAFAEGEETISVEESVAGALSGVTVMSTEITITDDDAAPTSIALSVSPSSVAESATATNVTVTATVEGSTRFSEAQTLTVSVGKSGDSAVEGTDYAEVDDIEITIAATAASGTHTFMLSPRDDAFAEGEETISVEGLLSGVTVTVTELTITDDDAAPTSIALSVSPSSVAEDVGTATSVTVTATVEGSTRFSEAQTLTVSVGKSGDSAVEGTDYAEVDDIEITIAATAASGTYTFELSPRDDAFAEGEETISVEGLLSGVTVTVTELTITDDDAAPTSIALSVSPSSVAEDVGTATSVTVTATVEGSTRFSEAQTLTVSVGKSGDSAVEGTDYAEVDDIEITIAATAASGTYTFELSPMDDAFAEGEETISVEESVAGALSGVAVTATEITITDDDAAPTSIALSVSPSSVAEDATAQSVTVTATVEGSTRFSEAQTLTVSVGKSGDSAVEGTDYGVVDDIEITIAATAASGTHTFMLSPMDDAFAEGEETISVEESVAGALSGVTVTSTEITITDDDAAPTSIALSVSPSSVAEGAAAQSVTVTATVEGSTRFSEAQTLTVSVGKSGDSAVEGTDYAEVDDIEITIAAIAASGTHTFMLSPMDDAFAEGEETISVEESMAGALSGVTVTATEITITDDDAAPTSIALSVSPSSVAESATATNVTVTATVEGSTRFSEAQTLTVSVGKSGDSAVEGTDYAEVDDIEITIAATAASGMHTFELSPMDDSISEGEETISVEESVAGALSGVTVTPTGITITDDDAAPTSIALSVSPSAVAEDVGTATSVTVTATVEGSSRFSEAQTLTVSVGTSGDSAVEGTDYAVVDDFAIVISADGASATGTFTLDPVDDAFAEGEETLTVSGLLSSVTVTATELTITDNDTASTDLVLTLSPASAVEGAGTANVDVTVGLDTDARTTATSVTLTISDDVATSPEDYSVSSPSVTLQIPAGMTEVTETIPIAIVDDNTAEEAETLTIAAEATGLTSASEEFTIEDNDTASDALVLTVAPARLHEDSGTSWIRFRADLSSAARPMDTPVEVSVTDGTATGGADYSISVIPSSIMIPAGETSIGDSLQITITDDDAVEGNETVVIGVSAPGLTGTMQDLVIIDDETAVRIDVINVIAQDDGSYTVTAAVRQNMGAPVTSVVLYYGDGITFEMAPMQSLGSLYTAELMAPAEGGILYYYVVATNGDGLTATYPPDGRYWDISNYTDDSRLLLLDFENGDAGDKSTAGHHVVYKGGAPTFAEGVLAMDGLDDYAEILGSDLGASEEFALELMFNADGLDAVALDGSEIYLVAKPAGCSTCWGESTFSLLWGGSDNSDTHVAVRFWNTEYEGEQIELEVPLSLVAGQWYHAVLEMRKEGAGRRAVLQLRDRSGLLYGEDEVVLPALPATSRYPIFVGHIGDRGFFDGRIDDVAFYNYAHFGLLSTSMENLREVPEGYVLEQNYPNPFNPVTTIRYDLAAVGHVSLEVSDLLGRRVAMLVNEVQQAGVQEVRFDAGDLPSGMYLYRLRIEDFVSVKKMVLVK